MVGDVPRARRAKHILWLLSRGYRYRLIARRISQGSKRPSPAPSPESAAYSVGPGMPNDWAWLG
jgi:hypothetical protein